MEIFIYKIIFFLSTILMIWIQTSNEIPFPSVHISEEIDDIDADEPKGGSTTEKHSDSSREDKNKFYQSNSIESDEIKPNPACDDQPDSGDGPLFNHMWYFNKEFAQCRELLYTGSGESRNMFVDRNECETKCLRHFIDGAVMIGPKIKAMVEHLHLRIDEPNKFFVRRKITIDQKEYNRRKRKELNELKEKNKKESSRKRSRRARN